MSVSSLILPFAVQAESLEPLNTEMETAVILVLTITKRGKLSFVSKLHYPIWIIPWGEKSLILDGLNSFSTQIYYQTLPNLEGFLEEIEQSARNRQHFKLSLEKHEKTFNDFAENIEVKIEGLISNREMLPAITEYIKEATPIKPNENQIFASIPTQLDEQTAIENAKKLFNLHNRTRTDIMGLEYTKKALNETVNLHEQKIIKEINFAQEIYNKKISELQPTVEEKVKKLEEKQEAEIAKINKIYGRVLEVKEKERNKLERELQKLELQKAELTKKRDIYRKRNNKISLARTEHKLKLCENKLREIKKRISEINKVTEETRKQHSSDVKKMQLNYQELVAKEKSKLETIEAQRDQVTFEKKKEIEAIKLTANKIAGQIEDMIKTKQQKQKELEFLAQPIKLEKAALAYLPFYLAGYKIENETKLRALWPMKVSALKGFMQTFRSILGLTSSKIRFATNPRSKILSQMLDSSLKKQISSNKSFAEVVRSATAAANILSSQCFKENLLKGLEELKAKGWIEKEATDAIIKQHF